MNYSSSWKHDWFMLQLDMEKAFDRVIWDFIEAITKNMKLDDNALCGDLY